MDQARFDALIRALTVSGSRRFMLGALLATPLAPLGASAAPRAKKNRKKRKQRRCLANGRRCGGRPRRQRGQTNFLPACSQCCSRYTRGKQKRRHCACRPAGKACRQHRECCGGQCQDGQCGGAASCPPGQQVCDGQCVDPQTDPRHCGGCDQVCPAEVACQNGSCQCDICESGCEFTSIQAAIDAAASGATVTICAGTYNERVNLTDDLTLVGAGADRTILNGMGVAGLPVLRCQAGTTATVRTLTITGSDLPGGDGGVWTDGTLTLEAVTVTGNQAQAGSGIFVTGIDGNVTLIDSSVTGNRAEVNDGGGIYVNTLSTARLMSGSTVTDNEANDRGGGIYNLGEVVVEAGASVTGNAASTEGGGIFTFDTGTTTIEPGATVEGNVPDNCAGPGTVNGTCPPP